MLTLVSFLFGCASLVPRDPVPETLVAEARVPGIDRARWWGDEVPADVAAEIRRNLRGITKLAESPREKGRPVVNYLALSSGGDDGAFATGVLVGWTRSGRRPRFEIVTDVSAGALIAPFALLGPAYDKDLGAMWTGNASADLITPQPLAVLLGGNALADSQPLAQLIAQYVNRRLLHAIAREYRGGRLLLVATTNLDVQRPVVWIAMAEATTRTRAVMSAYRRPQRVRIHEFRSQRSKTEAAAQIGPASRILTGDSSCRALQMGEWGVRGLAHVLFTYCSNPSNLSQAAIW